MRRPLRGTRRVLWLVVTPLVLLAGLGSAARHARTAVSPELKERARELSAALAAYGLDDVPAEDLREGMLRGMAIALGDPHSTYMDAEERQHAEDDHRGKYGGMGIYMRYEGASVRILVPRKGGPAAECGMQPDDRIVAVDGQELGGLQAPEVRRVLRGPPGSVAIVRVHRPRTGETFDVRLTRREVEMVTVSFARVVDAERKAGYLAIERFTRGTAKAFNAALAGLDEETGGLKTLILDLRRNGGGVMGEALRVADRFLDDGPIVHVRGPHIQDTVLATEDDTRRDLGLIVLVDRGTASAAEVLAGALRDHCRALLIGERTYGKASVQQRFPLSGGGAIKLTVERYLTPSGTPIHRSRRWRGGIQPHLALHQSMADRERLYQRRIQWSIDESGTAPPDAPRDEGADPVFDLALRVVRGEPVTVPIARPR